MRNDNEPKIRRIMALAKELPYFSLSTLAVIENDRNYLKVLLYRYKKAGKISALKKGLYVAKEYTDKLKMGGRFSDYPEFVSGIIYAPSYLSSEYVLYENNLLTEIPISFTAMTENKTAHFSNDFGSFLYRKIKKPLFIGFREIKKDGKSVYKATKSKALFDFLYLRKNAIVDKKSFSELRLNLEKMEKKDWRELERYIKIEGSKKMKAILNYIKKLHPVK